MKEDDAGGGSGEGPNEPKAKLKRKSEEFIPAGGKKAKKWMRKRKIQSAKWKKKSYPKKPKSLDGDKPKSSEKLPRRKRRMTESFNAPFNSTQFLMNDHKSEAVRHLDSTLNTSNNDNEDEVEIDLEMTERPLKRITRARESSFSIESDDDYYYSSPEDEEEFMSKEFIKDYDNVRNDRLIDMSKAELINEYLQMEQKIEVLEKRLQIKSADAIPENQKEVLSDTISKFQKEIQRLESENANLKKRRCSSSCNTSSCSSSSESDSSSSDSEDDSESEAETEAVLEPPKAAKILEVQADDTGYESGQSTKRVLNLEQNEEKEVVVSEEIRKADLISVNCITSTSPWT